MIAGVAPALLPHSLLRSRPAVRPGIARVLGMTALLGASLAAPCAFAQAPAAPAQTPASQAAPRKPAPATPAAPAAAAKPAADADNSPSRTSATYDDWVVRCERTEATGGAKVCEVAQTLQIGNAQQGVTAQVVFGKMKADSPLRLVLQIPVGAWLPAGAQLTIGDNAKPIVTTYKFCIRACIADVDLSAADAAALVKATGAGSLAFQDRNQTPIKLNISLNGLAAALAAREKM